MEQNPYANDDLATSSEYLRLAVLLLCKYEIPLTPPNYRLAYDYVSRNNAELKHAIDGILNDPKHPGHQHPNDRLWLTHLRFFGTLR